MTLAAVINLDLSPREIFRLSPDVASARTLGSLQRKIAFLESVAKSVEQARAIDVKLFRSRAALRKWHDSSHQLWRWGDGEIDKWSEMDPRQPRGRNEDLMLRWKAAVDGIMKLRRVKDHDVKAELMAKTLEIKKLEDQICDLMAQIDHLQRGD